MNYRQFGRTGIRVSEIGVGCGGLGGERKMGLEPVLERAVEMGINFFDTCDTYAETRSEQTLGRVLSRFPRDRIVLCTKFGGVIDSAGDWHRDISVPHLHDAFEASCRRLKTDYLDIYLVHTPPRDICSPANDELFAALQRMVEQGKIRAYGLSLEHGDFAIEFVNAHAAAGGLAIQIAFNLLTQSPRNGFLDVAEKLGVGVICKSPMANGSLAGSLVVDGPPPADDSRLANWGPERYAATAEKVRAVRPVLSRGGRTVAQGALAWLLSFPPVSTVIPGISSMARLEETAGADGMRISADELAELDSLLGTPGAG